MTDFRRILRILLVIVATASVASCGTIRTYGGIEHDYEYDFDDHHHKHKKHHKHHKHKKHKKHHHHHHDGFYEPCDDDDDD